MSRIERFILAVVFVICVRTLFGAGVQYWDYTHTGPARIGSAP